MLRSITVAIPDEASAKLNELARREYRRPKDQAAVLLLDALRRVELDTEARAGGRASAPAGTAR
jgi:predicted transcriptional regulator